MVSNRPQETYGRASQTLPPSGSSEALQSQDELATNATDPIPPQRELGSHRSQNNGTSGYNQCLVSGTEQQEVHTTPDVDSTAKQAARKATVGPSQLPCRYVSQATWEHISRENSQVRDHNTRLVQAESSYHRRHSELYKALTALNDRERDHQNTEVRLRRRLAELQTIIQQTNMRLEAERSTRLQEKMKVNTELVDAKAEAQLWQKSLEECKERIFRMQPLEHTTDAKLANQYENLCDAIGDWVDSHFSEYDNLLVGVTMVAWPEDSAKLLNAFLSHGGEFKTLLDHPQAGSVMLRLLIFRHLHFSLLHGDRVCAGLPEWSERLIKLIENGMKSLEPRRDEVVTGAWKADVQRALRQNSNVKSERVKFLHAVNRDIGVILAELIPKGQQSSYEVQSFDILSRESEDLAANIRLSTASYDFVFEFPANRPPESRVLYEKDLGQYRVLNEATGQPIRGVKSVQVGVDGRVGEKLCVVHPAMIRCGKAGESDLTLVAATILVKLDMPETRRGKTKAMELSVV